MRFLHTSDWHLGRSLGEHRLLDDQADFIDWLVDVVTAERVELVLVAGDLYDRPIPPASAVLLLREAFQRINAAGAEIVAIAGNHDSAERVAAYDGLTDSQGVLIRGGYQRAGGLVVREFSDGPLAIAPVPYLDPLLAPVPGSDLAPAADVDPTTDIRSAQNAAQTHDSVLASALARAAAALPPAVRSVAVAHAFVTGGMPAGSEREVSVGSTARVHIDHFAPFDYAALGHLHRPQLVGDDETRRYCGSPLAYSFGERGSKEVVLVDAPVDGPVHATTLEVPVGRGVGVIRGRFEELCSQPDATLVDRYVRIELTDSIVVLDAHRRLREIYPYVAEVAAVPDRLENNTDRRLADVAAEVDPVSQFEDFWADTTGDRPDDETLRRFEAALHRVAAGVTT